MDWLENAHPASSFAAHPALSALSPRLAYSEPRLRTNGTEVGCRQLVVVAAPRYMAATDVVDLTDTIKSTKRQKDAEHELSELSMLLSVLPPHTLPNLHIISLPPISLRIVSVSSS